MAAVQEASKIPTSTTQTESTVLEKPLDVVFSAFRGFAFHMLAPNKISETAFESGSENTVGAVVKLVYKDGSVWRIRVTEISERQHILAYELLTAEPAYVATSVQAELRFFAVTTENTTFVQWTTEFSNDADLTVISDQKYKKQEFFKDTKANL